jgi:hypothetical protein
VTRADGHEAIKSLREKVKAEEEIRARATPRNTCTRTTTVGSYTPTTRHGTCNTSLRPIAPDPRSATTRLRTAAPQSELSVIRASPTPLPAGIAGSFGGVSRVRQDQILVFLRGYARLARALDVAAAPASFASMSAIAGECATRGDIDAVRRACRVLAAGGLIELRRDESTPRRPLYARLCIDGDIDRSTGQPLPGTAR